MPGASELPSFVAVEITKDVPSLPAPVLEDKPATADDTPRRRRRKKAGLIEIELESGLRVRVDRDVLPYYACSAAKPAGGLRP